MEGQMCAVQIDSVNKNGYDKLLDISQRFAMEIAEVRKDTVFAGEIPFYSTMLLGVLDSEKLAQQKGV